MKWIKKINRGFGVELIFMYIILVQISGLLFAIITYYRKEIETDRFAKNISTILIHDEMIEKRYSEIGQYDTSEEQFNETIKLFLGHTKQLYEEYGNAFVNYLIFDDRYKLEELEKRNGDKFKIFKTLVNVKEISLPDGSIEPGSGIILSDNLFYYLKDEELKSAKIDFIQYSDCFNNNAFNKELLNPEYLSPNTGYYSNNSLYYYDFEDKEQRSVYFMPDLDIKLQENVTKEDLFNKTKSTQEIFEGITPKKMNTSKRYIIDKDKTEDIINTLINDYNKKLGYDKRAYKVEFVKYVDLLSSLENGDVESVYENYKKNNKSFFFYGNYETGVVNNYGYRIRDWQDVNGVSYDECYPFYSNALRLQLNTVLYLPFLGINQEISFGYDVILKRFNRNEQ